MRLFQHLAPVTFLLLAFDVAAACTCAPPRAPCNYYGNASAIFVGRAVGAAERKTVTDEHGNKTTYDVGTIHFSVQFNGIISGRVLDAAGEPAKEVHLRLGSADDENNERWTWTDKEGYYEFVRVQPGSYLLGFNLTWAPDKDTPYPKTFYPGVKTRSEAALITVGEGERLKGYDMTLPPRLSERELKVTVVWPDGRPAPGVMVYFEMNEATSLGDSVGTDTKGQATLTLFDNYHYIIYATVERNGQDVHATPVEVLVDKSLKPLRFVLSRKGYGLDEREALKRKSAN